MLSQLFSTTPLCHCVLVITFVPFTLTWVLDCGVPPWHVLVAKIKLGYHWSLLDEGPRLTMPP
jgi:hypothetical protein